MLSFDSEIQDQAYQFFVQEAVEFLQILETGLIDLTQDHSTPKVHELMRAAHSIKGGAASIGLNSIKQLAYQLEDCLRALYQDTVVVDTELEDLLLQAFDCLQGPLLQQVETGEHDEEAALAAAEPVYIALVERLGEALEQVDAAMPTSAELGIDIVQAIFAGDVQNGIQRIEQVLSNPNQQELVGEIRAQAEVFVGVGELVNLPGWVSIAQAILAAIQQSPDQARQIAEIATVDLKAAQKIVLDGDRVTGGAPSTALLAYSGDPAEAPAAELPTPTAPEVEEVSPQTFDTFDNAERIAAAATVFEEIPIASMSEDPIDFEALPTEQLDELFGLAMDPLDDFFAAEQASMPTVDPVLDQPDEVTTDALDFAAETPPIDNTSESMLAVDIPAPPLPADATPLAALPTDEAISSDDFANLDAFFDLALTDEPLPLTDAPFDLSQDLMADAPTPEASEPSELEATNPIEHSAAESIEPASESIELAQSTVAIPLPPPLETETAALPVQVEFPSSPITPLATPASDITSDTTDAPADPEDATLETATAAPESLDTMIYHLVDQPDDVIAQIAAETAPTATVTPELEADNAASVAPPVPVAPATVRDTAEANRVEAEAQNLASLSLNATVPEQAVALPLAADASVDTQIQNLLDNADRGVYHEPPRSVNRSTTTIKRRPANAAASSNNVVRVDLARLEQINNRVGAMVTQENATMLQNQQLQMTAKVMLQRFTQFEEIARQIGTWSDQSQKQRANLKQQQQQVVQPAASTDSTWQDDFDPLQMDTYGELYGFAQEMLELMAQIGEGMRDISQISQQAVSSQQKQQQTLKQIRDDLLWARMLPLGDLLQRFPRMMRDLSNRYGKPVKLDLSGTHTLVDKSILQSLYDPMVHLLRNGFDHGIESPEERLAQDKPAQATIAIRAYHRGNQTYIEIADDGRGIDPERIRAKIIEHELLTTAEAERLSAQEIYQYLFAAGFSTAGKVSELSGRGVGLDAVKSQVTSLKGSVSVASQMGEGTTFTLQLPLTLTVASLLVFTVQNCMMAAPIDALKAIISVPKRHIQMQQGRKIYHWDGQPVPLCPRSQFLNAYPLPRQMPDEFKAMPLPKDEMVTLLVIELADRQVMGLAADQILQEQELAIKPFGKAISAPHYFYGCTILGNGLLVPVLDVQALAKPETLVPKPIAHESLSLDDIRDRSTMTGVAIDRTPVILVVDDSLTTRQTLALTLQKAGYRVLQAKDGREGLEQVEREPDIQAVFSDVEMPRMNGFEFLGQCRQKYTKEQLPIIMLTSRGGDKHRQIAKFMGANEYLTKPYLAVDILKSLEAVLPQK
ncbi:response regulator [filamentous cyanobacterium LEGE 11480]|uniref:histidine kinase n=1 Tax=Romeriopsis navalis LEGE 11480 TaxID=2777977 RepID=A0A928VJX7_9CYAN|nr:response regulator [Romeriopsis navalis]MBE9029983.1 response regulator [Romeriopsis navalis LEGE 11480]